MHEIRWQNTSSLRDYIIWKMNSQSAATVTQEQRARGAEECGEVNVEGLNHPVKAMKLIRLLFL